MLVIVKDAPVTKKMQKNTTKVNSARKSTKKRNGDTPVVPPVMIVEVPSETPDNVLEYLPILPIKIITRRIVWSGVIEGEPSSKANSRRLVFRGKHPRIIKSESALQYAKSFDGQTTKQDAPFAGLVGAYMKIYYASRRKDLDESLILDQLQGVAYVNDRQVRLKIIEWAIDPERPRSEITIFSIGDADCRDPVTTPSKV
jgi:hypothetical protein